MRLLRGCLFASALFFLGTTSSISAAYVTDCYGCCYDFGLFSFHVDGLYWCPCPEGSYIAVKIENESPSFGETARQRVKFASDGGEFGVRIAAGYQPPCSDVDFLLRWTYFSPKQSKTTRIRDGNLILEPYEISNMTLSDFDDDNDFNSPFEKVRGKWKLDLHIVDLECGRQFYFCDYFGVRPHCGLRFACLDQHLHLKSEDDPLDDHLLLQHFSNEFNGVGPNLGVVLTYELGCGFGVSASAAYSMLYGDRSMKEKIELFRNTESTDSAVVKINNSKKCIRTTTDVSLGLFWETCVCNCFDFTANLAWEFHHFPNQGVADGDNCSGYGQSEVNHDLSTQGLVFGAGIDF